MLARLPNWPSFYARVSQCPYTTLSPGVPCATACCSNIPAPPGNLSRRWSSVERQRRCGSWSRGNHCKLMPQCEQVPTGLRGRGPCLPCVGPAARRSQCLRSVCVAGCQIVLENGPRPGIEECHLFEASARALIADAPGQFKDVQAKPLKKRLACQGIDA